MKKLIMSALLYLFVVPVYAAINVPAALPMKSPPVIAPATPAPPVVIDVDNMKLTKEQFDRLPDAQVLEFRGKRATAGELRARVQTLLSQRGTAKTTASEFSAKFQASRQKFLADQKAQIASANTQILGRVQQSGMRSTLAQAAAPQNKSATAEIAAAQQLAITAPASPVRINDCASTGAQDSMGNTHPGAAQPGSVISCTGVKFGDQAGFAVLKGLRKANGTASDIVLTVNSWSDSGNQTGNVSSAAFTIPGDLSGYRSQKAMILLTRRDGTPSNSFAIDFYPLLDMQQPWTVLGGNCSSTNNYNACGMGWAGRGGDGGSPRFVWETGTQYGAAHGGYCGSFMCFVNGDQGTDTWGGALANDWVFSDLNFGADPLWPNQTRAYGFTPGPSIKFSVAWSYDYGYSAAGTLYNFTLSAKGPLGVPLQ